MPGDPGVGGGRTQEALDTRNWGEVMAGRGGREESFLRPLLLMGVDGGGRDLGGQQRTSADVTFEE